ncbi:MAG: cytochrome c oxidase subunit II [Caldilineae bacterium]|nr:MAG: cytochrome c oxidase subunit II [Caldilineae bacterium]
MGKYGRHFGIVAVLVIIGAVIMNFLLKDILYKPAQASAQAVGVDRLFNLHLTLVAFFFSLIVVFMLYSVFVFRARDDDDSDGDFIHGHSALEITWTVVPLVIVIWLGFMGMGVLNDMTAAQPDEMVVDVVGRQWSWAFEYPDTGIQSTEMVVPKDKPILLKMTSPDVIHSFYVPEFRIKQDLVPGHVTEVRFTATATGVFPVRCAELCGTSHAYMLADIRVVEPSEYDAWVAEKLGGGGEDLAAKGAEIAQLQGCTGCHSLDGSRLVGPSWKGLFGHEVELEDGSTVTADEEYLRSSIVDPNAQIVATYPPSVMPATYGDTLSADDIEALIAYIKSLE